jgi:hypothetical protein
MPANFAADLNAMLGEPFGSPITAAGQSDSGVLTKSSEIVLGGDFVFVGPSVLAKSELFGGLEYGALMQIGGENYKVLHEPITAGDGLLCRIPLQLVPTPVVVRARRWLTTLGNQVRVTLAGEGLTTLPY